MSELVMYHSKTGNLELSVSFADETVWLTQQQMADLLGTKRQAVTKHLSNIFKSNELDKDSVSSKMELTAADGKKYKTQVYDLDAIISVGYRVNSSQATEFRIWATAVLKDHLIKGYSVHEKRLAEVGTKELEQSLELLQKTLTRNDLVTEIGRETIELIINYSKTWKLLLAYDEERLSLPTAGSKDGLVLHYDVVAPAIASLKCELMERGEGSDLFGREKDDSLKGILGNIEQTFDGKKLYKSIEERAAHLLYFVIKDHPFSDGNKRIGCLVFLMYLKLQTRAIRINDNGLVALALLVAESKPAQKDLIIRLIANLLID